MAKVKDVAALIKTIAPEEYSFKEEYDNVGLIVGRQEAEVRRVMCCLDVTNDVLDEAIEKKAELIISHHPVIYYPITRVSDEDVLGAKLYKAIENGIAIYAAHTNLDFVSGGLNDYAAELLGLIDVIPLNPYISETEGYGRIGRLPAKMSVQTLKKEAERVFNDKFVRIIGDPKKQVLKIAVVNGGGGGDLGVVDMAVKAGADCLVTGDVKHHVAVYASDSRLPIIEMQHFTTEQVYLSRLVQSMKIEAKSKKADIEIFQARRELCPRTN